MTYDEFKSFIPRFEAIRSFAGKMNAAKQYLGNPIGGGTGRAVFSFDDDKVLKLAKNAKGIAQNEAESNIGYYHDTQHIVTKIFDSDDDNYTWLVAEKGKKVNEKRIIELTGIPSLRKMVEYLKNFENSDYHRRKGSYDPFKIDDNTREILDNNEFTQDLQNLSANYNQSVGDMGAESSYGEVLRDGQPTIVLTDYGLSDEVYFAHYDRSRKQRYRNQMYELYNNTDGNDDILSDIGGGMDIRNGMFALAPDNVGINEEVLNEVTYDRQTADEIANEVAAKVGITNKPTYIGAGYFGAAYDIGNNQVLKITSDNSEAYENMELIGKPLKYIAKPYHVFQVKSESRNLPKKTYAIILEKLRTDNSFEAKMKRLKYAFEKILHESVGAVVLTYVNGNNGYVDIGKVEKYMAKNPQDKEFLDALIKIAEELKTYGIESVEYTNADNLGYTKNGDIGLFDVGFTDFFLNPQPEEINLNEFGGDSLYVTPDNMGGGDGFPTYNNNDTSPSIQNDLNANSAMYTEDLEYNHVSDATKDEYVLSEEVIPFSQDDYDEDEEYDLEDVSNQAYELAKRSGINILSDKELTGFVIDGGVVIGAIFVGLDNGNNEFSFDVVVDEKHRGTGIGKELTQYGIAEYNEYRSMFDGKLKLKLDVVNPYMRDLLKKHFRFKDIKQTGDNRYSMGLRERVMSSMKGSSTVDVKKKCRLAGNGNTSTPCNQGDISNLTIKPLHEEEQPNESELISDEIDVDGIKRSTTNSQGKLIYPTIEGITNFWIWFGDSNIVDDNGRPLVVYHGTNRDFDAFEHRYITSGIYGDGFYFAYDARDSQTKTSEYGNLMPSYISAKNLLIIGSQEYFDFIEKHNLYRGNAVATRLLGGLAQKEGYDAIRGTYGWGDQIVAFSANQIKSATGNKGTFNGASDNVIDEELLGTIDNEDEDFKDPIEAFRNPKSIKNMKPDIRGVIDSKTGDFYVVNAVNFLHAALNNWLNNNLGFNYATDFNSIYQNPFKIVPVQRDGSTNVFKLGELYTSAFDVDEMEKLMPQIQKVLDMAKAKNPEIEFSTEVIDTPTYPLREDIDASEAYRDEDGLQTIIDGKRNIAGFVTYNRKDLIQMLEDTGLNILPLTGNPHGLVIVFNDRGRENAMKLWKYATSKGGYFEDNTPEEARFIGKMLQYTDDSIERFVHRIYDENGQRRKKVYDEGVGDKYAEKKFGVEPEFSSFEKKFNKVQAEKNEDVIYNNGKLIIIKNPKSLTNVSPEVRGVINVNGDLYVEQHFGSIHAEIIKILVELGIINDNPLWRSTLPTDFITVQRFDNTNTFTFGESNTMLTPPDKRDNRDGWWNKYPKYEIALAEFQKYFDAAKRKNPQYEFLPVHPYYYNGLDKEENMDEDVDGLDNSSTFAAEIPVTNSSELMKESELMSLNDLPFKADVEAIGGKIYSVGGAVRDGFLGKESKDLDILITGVPFEELETILAKYGRVDSVGKSFGVLKFMPNDMKLDEPIDIAIPRTEKMTAGGGHKDFDITSDHALPIEKDLERRDFTINAIGKDSEGNIVDPFNGQEDLKNKIIRAVNPQAFSDDPLRMLRAVQFASRFGFTIEPTTMKMIQDNAERIKDITPERILIEFDKIVKKGNKRIAAQLLKDTGLFKNIFGFDIQQSTIDRSPFEDTHTMGEFLYLLTRLLPDPAIFYKTNLKGDIDTYKEIKALNMGLSNENENPIALRSVAYNMYGTSPQSLQSQILPTALRTAADELLSGKFPKTLGELAVNGNDLLERGLKGSEIGQALKKMLLKVYSGKVANDKDALLALLDSNDLDEAYGRRAADYDEDEFEKKLASQKQAAIGEVVGYVYAFVGSKRKYLPIYINPKSLQNFEGDVKAIGNIKGNLYVVLETGGFVHGEIALGAGLFNSVRDIYNNTESYVTLNRVDKTNTFEIGESTLEYAIKNDAMYNVDAILAAVKQKNPQYEYINTNRQLDKEKAGVYEGVGDKYAEKKFGIPDAGAEFEKKYQRNRLLIDGVEPFGFVTKFKGWSEDNNYGNSPEPVPVYKNPKSLRQFDYEVRGIGDEQGNIYVALVDDAFNHGDLAFNIGLTTNDDAVYEMLDKYLLITRVSDKDVFGLSDSTMRYMRNETNRENVKKQLVAAKRRNPQYDFIGKYYQNIRGNEEMNENLNETIKGGSYIMYHGSDYAFDKFTDEFVGGENANDEQGAGIYFTTELEQAQRYGKYVYKVELKPRKMTDVANKAVVSVANVTKLIKMSPTWKDDVLNWDENVMRGLAKAIKSLFDYSKNEKDMYQQIEHDFFRHNPKLFVRGMVSLGFDGQLIKFEGITHIIVYNPAIITILESNVDEEPQINEDMSRVLYSAIVLDNQSKQKLIKVFKPMIPEGYEILAHHMTLNMGGIDPKYKRDLGRDIELTVVDYAMDDKVMAVGVEGYPTNNKKAHITIAVNRTAGGKPMMSNNLTDWKSLGFSLKLTGTVTEVTN